MGDVCHFLMLPFRSSHAKTNGVETESVFFIWVVSCIVVSGLWMAYWLGPPILPKDFHSDGELFNHY